MKVMDKLKTDSRANWRLSLQNFGCTLFGRICGLRHRYVFTRAGFLRLRVVSILGLYLAAGIITAFVARPDYTSTSALQQLSAVQANQDIHIHQATAEIAPGNATATEEGLNGETQNGRLLMASLSRMADDVFNTATQAPAEMQGENSVQLASMIAVPLPKPDRRVFTVARGDSLSSILGSVSIKPGDAYQIVNSLTRCLIRVKCAKPENYLLKWSGMRQRRGLAQFPFGAKKPA